jgi:ubiquinone/menaquinone biosynthesis C-methylase UbiE
VRNSLRRLLQFPLRIFFALLYHQMAWTYDWVAAIVSLGQWQKWVRTTLKYLNGPRILELGHGPGHLQKGLSARTSGRAGSALVVGLDRSKQMGRLAARNLKREGCLCNLIHGDSDHLPFAPASFDQVVATFPSEFISYPQTLDEIFQVLKPGGQLVVLPVAWITGKSWLERGAASLFQVTGQAPKLDSQTLEPFRNAGFIVTSETVALSRSKLFFILADKPLSE